MSGEVLIVHPRVWAEHKGMLTDLAIYNGLAEIATVVRVGQVPRTVWPEPTPDRKDPET